MADPQKERKEAAPESLQDAEKRLESKSDDIAKHGYQPKYSDAELLEIAQGNSVLDERFHVRFMERQYLWAPGADRERQDLNNLTGTLGQPMADKSGIKFWSTSFGQIEDAGKDPQLISGKLGVEYKKNVEYTLILIDAEKAADLTAQQTVSTTFGGISRYANHEFPKDFPKAVTDSIMTKEFQELYSEYHAKASKGSFLRWDADQERFEKYLATTDLDKGTQKLLMHRMLMHDMIGNNQHFLGNGLTKNLNPESPNKHGVVETLNVGRKTVQLQELQQAQAIKVIPDLQRVQEVTKERDLYAGMTGDQLGKLRYQEMQKLAQPLREKAALEVGKLQTQHKDAQKKLEELQKREPQERKFMKSLGKDGYHKKREEWSKQHKAAQKKVWSIADRIEKLKAYAKPSSNPLYMSGAEKDALAKLEKQKPALIKKWNKAKKVEKEQLGKKIKAKHEKVKIQSKGKGMKLKCK